MATIEPTIRAGVRWLTLLIICSHSGCGGGECHETTLSTTKQARRSSTDYPKAILACALACAEHFRIQLMMHRQTSH